MDLALTGKRALVTGSTAGIGEAIARSLAAEGASVVLHGRDEERGAQLLREMADQGCRAAFVGADLGDPAQIDRLIEDAIKAFGGIDILVNNAAIYPQHHWFGSESSNWGRIYSINVVSCVRLIQSLVLPMKSAGWGRVINISSGEASRPFAHMPGYAASKAALNNLTVSLCQELAGSGVTVNAISAGLIRTAEVERWFRAEAKTRGWKSDWHEIEKNIINQYLPIPAGRLGTPVDMASGTVFLASPISSYINGAIIRVDGGSYTWAA